VNGRAALHHAHIDAVAFDFDGTLADTHGAIVATMAQTFAALGVPGLPSAVVASMIGLQLEHVLREGGVAERGIEDAVAIYRARFPDNAREVALFDGVEACLLELAEARVPIAICSSRGRTSLNELLEQLGIHARFAHVVGKEDAARPKPAPDLVNVLGRALGKSPSRMLVVGDTTYDIEMGKAAGAHTCGVTSGSHDAARLQSAGPTLVVDSLGGLWGRLRGSGPAATSNAS
jgi:phosphoglycolate phosphatase